MATMHNPPQLPVLGARADDSALQRFVQDNISVNAWPIQSHALRQCIVTQGLDLNLSAGFGLTLVHLAAMMRYICRLSRRTERLLKINNAFHHTQHNFEVFIRLLVLEWPAGVTLPPDLEAAPRRLYASMDELLPQVVALVAALLDCGVAEHIIARDALAALGHDFGHSGCPDRINSLGQLMPLTHEETAEKHVAKVGLRFGFPPALILQAMAGIRATTFFNRPGRQRITPANEFERRLTLADVMGCVLPVDQWLTHVGLPVLLEKIPFWNLRSGVPEGQVIRTVGEWLHSERNFFMFIESHKLDPVAGARSLWGAIIQEKIVILETMLMQHALLEQMDARGYDFLVDFAHKLAHAPSLAERLGHADIDPHLRQLLLPLTLE